MDEKEKELLSGMEFYHKEFEQCLEKMENYKRELEAIKSSKWWKLREKIKGNGKKDGQK